MYEKTLGFLYINFKINYCILRKGALLYTQPYNTQPFTEGDLLMQNQIFLQDQLQKILDTRAKAIGITTSAFITDFLTQSFKDELNGIPDKSYIDLYTELREAVIGYKNTLKSGDKFTLRDVDYYKNLSATTVSGTHSIPAATRARLGRSLNEDIRLNKSPEFADVKRALTKSGKPAFSKANNTSAAIYEKI